MGREAKARKVGETRVTLSKEDFFELRARIADLTIIEFEALKAATRLKDQAALALQAKDRLWRELATKYSFDPLPNYRMDDQACALVLTKLQEVLTE